ncbi:MAG: STT3 domain-containing protein [Desulfovibrionaceae bacterium]|nr:STT3 domain-containing protein [Desulfovibrionaceae bacterium]
MFRHICGIETLKSSIPPWTIGVALAILTYTAAFALRMTEWPSWQNPEFSLNGEMLLSTHDAYHWVAGADGFGRSIGHPMSELLRTLAFYLCTDPVTVAFWLPPIMASMVAVLVFFWASSMGSMEAGVGAGLLATLTPGFLGRTLLGYADTDLITVFLPLAFSLGPACWISCFLRHPLAILYVRRCGCSPGKNMPSFFEAASHAPASLLAPHWIFFLGFCGILSWYSQAWHSLFPYLIRFNAALFGIMALLFAKPGERRSALICAVSYALPALAGLPGLIPALMLFVSGLLRSRTPSRLLHNPLILTGLWLCAALYIFNAEIFATLFHHVDGYLKRSGDAVSSTLADPLVFPSVAQSILEIQDLSLRDIPAYFHPTSAIAWTGFIGFLIVLCLRPGAFFLLPMAVLTVLSMKMGGRMVMFGAPVFAMGLMLPADWLVCLLGDSRYALLRRIFLLLVLSAAAMLLFPPLRTSLAAVWHVPLPYGITAAVCLASICLVTAGRCQRWPFILHLDAIGPHLLYRSLAVIMLGSITIPVLTELIPGLTQGPILNRRHAEALQSLSISTPKDAVIWHWWDWGYATHHFSRRPTIADGADHGGASLFLPAAVYAAEDPRFARQIIKYTALKGNISGNVFSGMTSSQAGHLMASLANAQEPLIQAPGHQYLVVSYDMINLGFWITTFGNWDFTSKTGIGNAISIIPYALSYSLEKGEIRLKRSGVTVPAASIDVFSDGRLEHQDYTAVPENLSQPLKLWQKQAQKRRNVHFLLNQITGEKIVADDRLYRSLLIQLLICPPRDPRFSPYFRLIYDNVLCRIYEVI